MEGTCSPMINGLRVLGLFDNSDIASFTSYGLHKKSELINQYCNSWNLKFNLNISKITVFKKGGKL
jgi:hypothetical protein